MQHKLVSSIRPTRYASHDSCSAIMAVSLNRKLVPVLVCDRSVTISLTSRWKGAFRMSRLDEFWYFRISRKAFLLGRYLLFCFGGGGCLAATFIAIATFCPVGYGMTSIGGLLRTVCLVLAMIAFLHNTYIFLLFVVGACPIFIMRGVVKIVEFKTRHVKATHTPVRYQHHA